MTAHAPARRGSRALNWSVSVLGVALLAAGIGGWWWWHWRTSQQAMEACLLAVKEKRWDEARKWSDIWSRRRPQDASAWLTRAEIMRRQQDWAETDESLSRVPPDDRRYLNTQALRGDLVLEELHDPHRAIEIWQNLLRAAPTSQLAHQRLIYLYAMTLQRAEMIQQIRTAIRHRAEPPEAYGYLLAANALVFSDGFPRVSRWLQHFPHDETLRVAQAVFAARTNPSRGQRMFGVGDGLKANLYLIEKCRADYPHNLEVLAYDLETAISEARFARVGELLQNLPDTAEDESRFWRYRGTWLDSQRRTAEAMEAYQQAVKLHPLDWRAHHELGGVARIMRQSDVAAYHANLGQRGKLLEKRTLELPNATQADLKLMHELWEYARDCGDADVVEGLTYRLGIREGKTPEASGAP